MAFHMIFVCSASICRSPVAAALARAAVETGASEDVVVSSGGVRVMPGAPECPDARRWLDKRGATSSDLAAVALSRDLIESADLVLAADRMVMATVSRAVPAVRPRAFTFTEAAALASALRRSQVPGVDLATHVPGAGGALGWRPAVDLLNAARGRVYPEPPARGLGSRLLRRRSESGYDIPDAHDEDADASHRRVLGAVTDSVQSLCDDLLTLSTSR